MLENSSDKIESLFKEHPDVFGEETSSIKDESITLLPVKALYVDTEEEQGKMIQHQEFRDKVLELAKIDA
jgi:hypothetical protein